MAEMKQLYRTNDANFFINNFLKITDAVRNKDDLNVCLLKIPFDRNLQTQQDSYHLQVLKQFKDQKHDNILNVLDIHDNIQGYTYIVMEKCNNTLQHYLENNKLAFSTQQIYSFLRQISRGYQQLIEKGILLRNLRPENIFYIIINQDMQFKISGYDKAKLLDDRDQPIEENTKQIFENYYQAPEVTTETYSYIAEIYSLGLILLEVATRQRVLNKNLLKRQKIEKLCVLDKIDPKIQQLLCQMVVYDHTKRLSWSELIKQLFYQAEQISESFEILTCLENNKSCFVKKIKKPIKDCQYIAQNSKIELEINRKLQGINYSNIVKVYEVLHEPENPYIYIIMEKCQGSLSDLLKTKHFKTEDVFDLIVQINNGYQYLEANTIIHRDIKPENILYLMVDNCIQYMIADFGISRQTDDAYSKCGTLPYSAPEINGNNQYTNACDIFSLGILIFYVVTKQYPFQQNKISQNQFYQFLNEKKSLEQIIQLNNLQIPKFDDKILTILNRMIIYEAKNRISWGQEITQLINQLKTPQKQQFNQIQKNPIFIKPQTSPMRQQLQIQPTKQQPQTQPTQQFPQTLPMKQQLQIQPTKQQPQTQPTQQLPQTSPKKQQLQIQPTKQQPQTQPIQYFPQTSPMKQQLQIQPIKWQPQTQPTQQLPQTSPKKQQLQIQPTKQLPQTQPIQQFPQTSPIKQQLQIQPTKQQPQTQPIKQQPQTQPIISNHQIQFPQQNFQMAQNLPQNPKFPTQFKEVPPNNIQTPKFKTKLNEFKNIG